jgi:nitrogen regulatory protein PII
MKLITTVMKPFKLDEVRQALMDLGLHGMTATEVKGFGRQKGQAEVYRGSEYEVSYLPKMKLEVIVDDTQVDAAISVIQNQAHTGRIGDGKIFVLDCAEVIRIRTGERGASAL